MSEYLKKLAIICFVIFHLIMIVLFNLPDNVKSEKVKIYNSMYVKPFFYQKWNMFAPVSKFKINVTATLKEGCNHSNDTIWIPYKSSYDFHKYTWFTHHGKIALISMYFNFNVAFENDTNNSAFILGDTSSVQFKKFYHALKIQAKRENIKCEVKRVLFEVTNVYNNQNKKIVYNL